MARTHTDLSHLKAVVTGGSRGIGRAIAEALARAGAQVIISSVNTSNLAEAERALQAAGLNVSGIRCDVSHRTEVEALAAAAAERMGRIDLWVNNAGISGPFGYALDVPPEAWEQVIRVNLLGTYYGCRAALPYMIGQRNGQIINLSGGGAKRAQRFLSAYSTSKAAIVRLTEAFARDYQDHPYLRFNVLTPGMVPTDMINHFETVGPGGEAIKQLPPVLRIIGTTAEETAALALRIVREGKNGQVFEVMPRHRAIWRLLKAAVQRNR
jgi:NAD(P)-dependent dehydrogenase (short-subunit alcohol dehydrogenase family)